MSRRRASKRGAGQAKPVRPGPGVNVFLESLKGRRIVGEPSPALDHLAPDDLADAQAVLHRFSLAGRKKRRPVRTDFNDPYAVATLELLSRRQADPRTTGSIGAWVHRMQERGLGHCSPLHGAAEGLHVLVLDAQAVAELYDAVAEQRAAVERFSQLQADLAELAERRSRGQS